MPNDSRSEPRFGAVPRRGAVALVTTILAVILLLGFRTPEGASFARPTPTAAVGQPRAAAPTPRAIAGNPRGGVGGRPTPVATQHPTGGGGNGSGQFTGQVISTRYGEVQVEVTEQGGTITDVQALQLPFDRRLSAQISQYVAPIFHDEALQAQSANIDAVSGATYTSMAYRQSLQSALDQAGR